MTKSVRLDTSAGPIHIELDEVKAPLSTQNFLDYVKANNVVPEIVSWHSLPGDPVANVLIADHTLRRRHRRSPPWDRRVAGSRGPRAARARAYGRASSR